MKALLLNLAKVCNLRKVILPITVAAILLLTSAALAQIGGGYDLAWFTLASGGGSSQGGSFSVDDTLGQPMAHDGSSGGPYSVQGGFWGGITEDAITTTRVHVIAILSFDNNLDPLTAEVVERFRQGTLGQSDLSATLLVDQAGDGDTEVIVIAGGVVTHTNAIPWLSGVHELDTANPETIAAFLNWSRSTQSPFGSRTVVALLGHGAGLTPEAHLPRSGRLGIQSSLPPLPSQRDNTPVDVTSGTYLSTPELGRALAAATGNGANPFDVLFFDSCFEGSLDVLYEIRNTSSVLVALPNYGWSGFFYDRYLPRFSSSATPDAERMAQAIIEEYEAALDDQHPNVIFWVRGTDVGGIADAVSGLGDALRSEIAGNDLLILAATLSSQFADTTLSAGDLELGPPDELMGAGSFAANLRARFTVGSPVHTAAGNVLAQLANVHSAYRIGHPWLKPENTWTYTDTLTLLAPLTRTLATDLAWRRTIYTSTTPVTATWAAQPTQTVVITTPLAYTVNGRWDDFIAAWYTPATPMIGALYHAMPPTLIISGTAALTLTAQPGLDSVQLSWVAPTHPELADYAVYARWPDGPTWELLAITQMLAYQHAGLASGRYAYFVAARNAQGHVLALSNQVSVDVGITSVSPDRGLNNVPAGIYIRGAGFVEPITVTVGLTPLADVVALGPTLLRAVVPAGMAPATYDVAVSTRASRAVAYGAYRVLDAEMVDDLLSFEEWLWTDPTPLRVGNANSQIGLIVQRLGGKSTLMDGVAVEFRLGGPQGTVLGRGWTPPVAPFTTTATTPVSWTPQSAGLHLICAIIDPDHQVTETDETNNVTCRTVTVLSSGVDTLPPVIDHFVIEHDAPNTPGVTVTLDVTATDYALGTTPLSGASGVLACKFIEFEYSLGARRWVPVQQSGWVDYPTAHHNYPWVLIPTYGMRYLQAWCADHASNISLNPGVDMINLLPSAQEGYVAEHGVVLFRTYLEQGQAFIVRLTPVDGDPDLYIWGPNSQLWHSNNPTGEDVVTSNAPVTGTYQIEVHGFTEAHYRLTIEAQTQQAQYLRAQAANAKPLPTTPAIPVSDTPLYVQVTPPQPTPLHSLYLPVVMR